MGGEWLMVSAQSDGNKKGGILLVCSLSPGISFYWPIKITMLDNLFFDVSWFTYSYSN